MKKLFIVIAICLFWTQWSHAQIKLGTDTSVKFATPDEARKILTVQDDFVQRMSPFDRAGRMKKVKDVSEKEYLEFVSKNILPWKDLERKKMTAAFQGIMKNLDVYSLPFPKEVFIIKTTGLEEGGSAYTRANAIIFPKADLSGPMKKIQKTICHELFHIMTRANPELSEKLYTAIGFVKCNEVEFPSSMKSRKLTNPDAPLNDHYIRLQSGGETCLAIPIIYSKTEKYDLKRGGEFFDDLQFQFLFVEQSKKLSAVNPIYEGQKPKLADVNEVSGFFEQVGKNTELIIHPEEILASNFECLIMQDTGLPSPEIIGKLKEIFMKRSAELSKS